ncbi:MAG TPA: molybdopterin oxidoreductase family protein [Candidatus Lokiarchaeia archaeon]|nr:molybdopterin oxidoreductase family protein [Candidatus Lokiarchaeia archaeon]
MASEKIHLTCGYCSTGCNMLYDPSNEKFPVTGNPAYPVNLGKACPKGFQMLGHLGAEDRATTPYIRDETGKLVPVDWDAAIDAFITNFKRIQAEHGNESVAFLSTGQIASEEHALLGCLAKFGMGMIHGDGNTRQCMAAAVTAYKQSFGWDAPPETYKDFELSDVLVFVGSNPVIAHPILWNRVKMNQNHPKIIVIDPRITATAKEATKHFAIKPKSELYFLYSVAHELVNNGWIDQAFIDDHTTGFDEFKAHVESFDPRLLEETTGIIASDVEDLARIIHEGERASFWWMVGVNQAHQATRTAQAIINLALMTGNIGKPGTGANSITGQCNAMGSRMFSNTTALIGGHSFENLEHREKVAGILGIEPDRIPSKGSWTYEKILEGVLDGNIKGLWIVCTNPVHSWIDSSKLPEWFKNLEYLVVQDLFCTTETAQLANLILPAAGNGEKWGTFINSERRISVLQPAFTPPGDALPDFYIFKKIADAWGCGDMFAEWESPEKAFQIIKRLTKGLPWDITGIEDYNFIIQNGGVQWPYPENAPNPPEQERRLFESQQFYHEDERATFLFEDVEPAPELPDDEYPFVLLTGRGSVAQWHTQTRTSKVPVLVKMAPKDAYVDINAEDADRLEISNGDHVTVKSRRGEAIVDAKISDEVLPGQVFMPMHYPETNRLTYPSFDKYSHQPMYKYSTVSLSK